MLGAIRKRDVLAHPWVTIQCFGWRVFGSALIAGSHRTFLSLLVDAEAMRPAAGAASGDPKEFVRRCVALERQAMKIYESLAPLFAQPEAQEFFRVLAAQEQLHAEMLELCARAGGREAWPPGHFDAQRGTLRELEVQMRQAEAKTRCVHCLADGLWLVLEIESSEVNRLFQTVVGTADSPLPRAIKSFQTATLEHLSYIAERVEHFEPELKPSCDRMLALYREPASQTVSGSV